MKLLAQNLIFPGEDPVTGDPNMISGSVTTLTNLGAIISRAMSVIFAVAGLGLLLMIISAGFTLLTSAGDAKKTEMGSKRLTYAIVGFIIIFAAYWGVQIAGTIFGFKEITAIFN